MKTPLVLLTFLLALSPFAPLTASAFTPDVEILTLKGYSPETIETTMVARSRAEWRGTAPSKRSPLQRFFYNILHGSLIDSVDETGYNIIRRN
jgi:hypothetical protein